MTGSTKEALRQEALLRRTSANSSTSSEEGSTFSTAHTPRVAIDGAALWSRRRRRTAELPYLGRVLHQLGVDPGDHVRHGPLRIVMPRKRCDGLQVRFLQQCKRGKPSGPERSEPRDGGRPVTGPDDVTPVRWSPPLRMFDRDGPPPADVPDHPSDRRIWRGGCPGARPVGRPHPVRGRADREAPGRRLPEEVAWLQAVEVEFQQSPGEVELPPEHVTPRDHEGIVFRSPSLLRADTLTFSAPKLRRSEQDRSLWALAGPPAFLCSARP